MVKRLLNSGCRVMPIPHPKPDTTSTTLVASITGPNDHGENSHDFELELEIKQTESTASSAELSLEATGIVVWVLSLYHITGKSEIALNLVNKSSCGLTPIHSCHKIEMALEACSTPSKLFEMLHENVAHTNVRHAAAGNTMSSTDDEHTFIRWNDGSSSSIFGFKKNQISRVHFHADGDTARLRIQWRDSSHDHAELKGILTRVASFVSTQLECPIRSMQNPASGQLQLASAKPPPSPTPEQTIHGLFRATSSRWPSNTAVDAWDGVFTHAELDAVSSCWASTLTSKSSFVGQRVLHVFDHSRWAIVAWIALLKAGCACIPVDTSAPEERIKSIVQKTGCTGAICDATRAKTLASLVQEILTPDELNNLKSSSEGYHGDWSDSSRASMIMHTSGSTGEPKGVVQSHAAVTSSIVRVAEVLQLDETSRFLQFASHSFDVSITEIFVPLCVGGCIVIPSQEDKVGRIVENINSMQVTHALLTPTVVRTFSPDEVPGLRNLALGGERASSELRRLWSTQLNLTILYGTTETAVWDTVAQISKENVDNPRLIGHPIGSRLWVTHPNDWTKLSPIGVAGEICIQGPEIGDYYIGRPEQTAHAFKSAPAWLPKEDMDSASHRIYRTGDLGRVMSDGSLEIWGRIDRQIKLNGQRMEPAEIEENIMRFLPSHLRVYVELLQPTNEKARLAAFVCHEEKAIPSISPETKHGDEIRKAFVDVRSMLPKSMIPTIIVPVTSLPLTISKKINRRELQRLGLEFVGSWKQPKAPMPGNKLASLSGKNFDAQTIVQKVLGFMKPKAGHEDGQDITLSEAGLDSLDAVEISSTLRKVAQIHVPASMILRPGVKISDIAALAQSSEQEIEHKARLQQELTQWTTKLDHISATAGRSVLLTGATGFLGREILHQLLSHPDQWTIICVVRGDSPQHARERLMSAIGKQKWWDASLEQRIEVWPGDLSLPNLGLLHCEWRDVFGLHGRARRVHTIIHNGAVVNWLASYDALAESNVGSTYELLRGHLQSHDAPDLVFMSGGYISGQEETRDEVAAKICRMPGYDQTKFVSETMIEHFNGSVARTGGGSVSVFKPGFIIGSSTGGETQTRDALWRFVKACVQTGTYSEEDARKWIPVAGVDSIASMLVADMPVERRQDTKGWCHKVLVGCYLQDIWDIIAGLGLSLNPTEHEVWLSKMNSSMESVGREHPLFPLKDWMVESGGFMGTEPPEKGNISDVDNADARLAVGRSLEHLVECGFLLGLEARPRSTAPSH